MSQFLTLELSDTDYAEIRQRAELAGVTITEWAIASLKVHKQLNKPKLQNEAEKQAARQTPKVSPSCRVNQSRLCNRCR